MSSVFKELAKINKMNTNYNNYSVFIRGTLREQLKDSIKGLPFYLKQPWLNTNHYVMLSLNDFFVMLVTNCKHIYRMTVSKEGYHDQLTEGANGHNGNSNIIASTMRSYARTRKRVKRWRMTENLLALVALITQKPTIRSLVALPPVAVQNAAKQVHFAAQAWERGAIFHIWEIFNQHGNRRLPRMINAPCPVQRTRKPWAPATRVCRCNRAMYRSRFCHTCKQTTN